MAGGDPEEACWVERLSESESLGLAREMETASETLDAVEQGCAGW